MAPNSASQLVESRVPSQPELIVPAKEGAATARVLNTDQEQRAKTDRAKGWYDYKVVFDDLSYGLRQHLAKFVPEHLESSLPSDFDFDTWTVVPDSEAKLFYPFTNSKHTDCVLNLTGMPPSFSRMPNYAARNMAYQIADCVVLLAHESYSPQMHVESLLHSLDYRGWLSRMASSAASKPKPVVYLMPSVSSEQFKVPFLAQRRGQAQEMLKQYPEVLVLEVDFSDRNSISKSLQQVVQYIKSGKGVVPGKATEPTTPTADSWFGWLFSNSSTPLAAKPPKQDSPPTSSFSFTNLFSRK